MNRLPTPNSFQGVLDSIIRNYLINELPPDGGESSRRNVAENDLSFMQGFQLANGTGNGNTSNGNANGTRGINLTANSSDQEYIQAVYKWYDRYNLKCIILYTVFLLLDCILMSVFSFFPKF